VTAEAGSVAEALEVLEHLRSAPVLTDVILPGGKSGPDMARELATREPRLEFLFMSGYAPSEIGERELLDRGVELLNRPFTRRELANGVYSALQQSS
jgi:FixJ family two-component response regulator